MTVQNDPFDHEDDEMIGVPDWNRRDSSEEDEEDHGFPSHFPGDDDDGEDTRMERSRPGNEHLITPVEDEDEDESHFIDGPIEEATHSHMPGDEPFVSTVPADTTRLASWDESGKEPDQKDSDSEDEGKSLESDSESGEDNAWGFADLIQDDSSAEEDDDLEDDDADQDGEPESYAYETESSEEGYVEVRRPQIFATERKENDIVLDDAFIEDVSADLERYKAVSAVHKGREAFKTSLVLPLLSSLGYDVFSPDEVEPIESEADGHEGYLVRSHADKFVALLHDRQPGERFAGEIVLHIKVDGMTAGVQTESKDSKESVWQPIFEIALSDDEANLGKLYRFHREAFSADEMFMLASQLEGQQEYLLEAMKAVIENARNGFVEDVRAELERNGHDNVLMLKERIAIAAANLFQEQAPAQHKAEEARPEAKEEKAPEEGEEEKSEKGRPVTPAEQQAFDLIQSLCGPEIAPERIFARPAKTYLAVLLDNNNRKTIARLHFSAAKKRYIGLFNEGDETKHLIASIDAIEDHKDALRERAKEIDPEAFA